MAGVMLSRNQYDIEKIGKKTNVPNNPKAKLMFYLRCVSSVLSLNDDGDISDLIDYKNYHRLSEDDYVKLLTLCMLVEPRILVNQCFFLAPQLCGDSSNEFYKITAVNTNLACADSIVIGGVRKRVEKVMVFKEGWLEEHYIEPFKSFNEEMERKKREAARKSDGCSVM